MFKKLEPMMVRKICIKKDGMLRQERVTPILADAKEIPTQRAKKTKREILRKEEASYA
jgi:hypothetical protein